jgi:hypothetical protein
MMLAVRVMLGVHGAGGGERRPSRLAITPAKALM